MKGDAMATDEGATDQEGSVTILIKALKTGDPDAARQLWERYFADLVRLARLRLHDTPRAARRRGDIALNAFYSLCRGAEGGRFPRLDNREDLWRVLLMITARKASNLIEHKHRSKHGGGRVIAEAVLAAEAFHADGELDQAPGRDPSPEMAALVVDEYRRLFGTCPTSR